MKTPVTKLGMVGSSSSAVKRDSYSVHLKDAINFSVFLILAVLVVGSLILWALFHSEAAVWYVALSLSFFVGVLFSAFKDLYRRIKVLRTVKQIVADMENLYKSLK